MPTGHDEMNAAFRRARLRGTAQPAEDGDQGEGKPPHGSADGGAKGEPGPERPSMNALLRAKRIVARQQVDATARDLEADR